jgi:hypothetical protein
MGRVGVRDSRVNIYAAISGDVSRVVAAEYPSLLVSFALDKRGVFFDELPYAPPNRLGDSGAFTVWTQGKTIDRDALIDWCRANVAKHASFRCISLDVIPGTPGGNNAPTRRERDAAFAESLDNGDAMRAAGLKVVEVYHVFEAIENLDMLLDRRQPGEMIALGGMVGRSSSLKRAFCDLVFSRLRDRAGGWQGIVPVHGLGVAPRHGSIALAWRYPWLSIDSTSWLNPSKYGEVITRDGHHRRSDGHRHAPIADIRIARLLSAWKRREAEATSMWAMRGVSFCE